jgi:peptide/nickel transport system ATP-binding protein
MATLPKKLLMPKLEEILKLTVHVPDSMPNIALDVPPYPILQVEQLKVHFPIRRGLFKRVVGTIKAVDGVSFPIYEGQTLGLVGESGCGKTTLGKSVLRLIDSNNGKIVFQDTDLAKLSQRKMRKYRHDLQIIFQDPYSSMDPRMRVHDIIEEGMITLNIGSDDQERQDRIDSLLSQVGLSQKHQWRFPHELSGGQRQRVAIARALAVGAKLIICDEPTSALDLSVQAQILNLLRSLQEDLGISFLFITHNIGVVNYLADQIAVMYLGRIVEYGPARAVLDSPKHPYTQALLKSLPTLEKAQQKLEPPKGEVPSITNPPKGCHFSPRCPFVHERCIARYPDAYVAGEQSVKCYLYSPEEIGQINDEKISAPAGA